MWGYTDCRAVSGLLWNYTAHRLSELEIERVEAHLIGCGACRAEADAYRQAVDGLAAMRQRPVPDSQRGWHELRERLTVPESRPSPARQIWSFPTLAWGMAAVTAGLALFLIGPIGNRAVTQTLEETGIRPSGSATIAQLPSRGAESVEAGNYASGIDPEELSAFANAHADRPMPTNTASASVKSIRRAPRRFAQLALGVPSAGHRRIAGVSSQTRSGRRLDYAHMDGRSSANTGDNSDYVLTHVSAVSESEATADYVMGRVMMSVRSTDAEVARGW